MTDEREPVRIGEHLANESAKNLFSNMEAYCGYEHQAIELRNNPRVLQLQYESQLLLNEEKDLVERLRHAPPPGSLRSRRLKAIFYWALTILLTAASFYFMFIALEPFRLGAKAIPYCVGLALTTPFLFSQALERWNTEKFFKWAATVACVAAIAGMLVLAIIRGTIFMQELQSAAPPVVIDDAQPQATAPQPDFYQSTTLYLMAFMLHAALAMDLGAGLSLHEAWRMQRDDRSEDWEALRNRLSEVRNGLTAIIGEVAALRDAPELFATEFYRDFYRALLTSTMRSAITKLLLFVLCLLGLADVRATAQTEQLNLVLAVDLTKSVDVKGLDGKTEFQKNLDAVGNILAHVPAATQITIIGITDASFSKPYILLSAKVAGDPGYFGESLRTARNALVSSWVKRARTLEPIFPRTDVVGALILSGQVFDQAEDMKALVILSDMRNSTPELDLEVPVEVPRHEINAESFVPPEAKLTGVRVFVLGVDGFGRSTIYWNSLRRFWVAYFVSTNADLREYSPLRDHSMIFTP